MKFKSIPIGFLAVLDEQVVEELGHDAYQRRCGAAESGICKVCRREYDDHSLTLGRALFGAQGQPITSLANKPAQPRRVGASVKRISTEEKLTRSVVVSTTDVHVARDIGAAVRRAQSELDNLQQKGLRVIWRH